MWSNNKNAHKYAASNSLNNSEQFKSSNDIFFSGENDDIPIKIN